MSKPTRGQRVRITTEYPDGRTTTHTGEIESANSAYGYDFQDDNHGSRFVASAEALAEHGITRTFEPDN